MVAENDQNLSLESKLGLLSFDWDSSEFIKVNTEICQSCEKKPCLYVCPSEVYTLNDEELVYNIEGCIEMGLCTIACDQLGKGAIEWNHPQGGKGVSYKLG